MSDHTPFRCYVMGSESLLVQCTEILLREGHKVLGVITDDEELLAFAAGKSLPTIAPGKGLAERLTAPFDWFLSIANLKIIPDDVLALPAQGAINFHDGPLPRYAGINAPTWAILAGERSHGVSWHLIEGGVDEGDLLEQRIFDLAPRETAFTLNTRCYELAIESFGAMVAALGKGEVRRQKQDLEKRTYFARHQRPEAACAIDFDQPSHAIEALVRALDYGPYPNPIGVPKAVLAKGAVLLPEVKRGAESTSEAPGTVLAIDDDGLEVATQTGSLVFPRVLDIGGSPLTPAAAFALGVTPGSSLTTPAQTRARLSAVQEALVPAEAFWLRRLSQLEPARVPSAKPAERAARVERRALPWAPEAATLIAAVGAWLARVGGKASFDLGLRHGGIADAIAGAESLYAADASLRLDVERAAPFAQLRDAVTAELERAQKRGSWPREIFLRQPAARRATPELFALLDVAPDGAQLPEGAVAALAFDGSSAGLLFDAHRLDPEAADDMVRQVSALLAAAAADEAATVDELALLTDEERRRILQEWNDTSREYARDKTVPQLIEAWVDEAPERAALVYRDQTLSYAALDRRANQLAHRLIAAGVKPDAPVGLCTDRSLDLVVGALAIQKAGGAYVPLDPSYPKDRLAFMLEDSGASVVVTQTEAAAVLPAEGSAARLLLDVEATFSGQPETRPAVAGLGAENLAYLIYTSGSTGTPKGVMVEHRNVANFFAGMDERIPHEHPSADAPLTWLAVTSLSFDISVLELFYTLARGFTVVLSSDEDRALVSGGGAGVSAYDGRKIDFSLFYFASDEGEASQQSDKYQLLLDGARFADENGFRAVWTPERHFHAFGGLYPNPAVASAALAVITKNVKIRAGSCVNPLHHPVRVAEEWSLVDNLSKGRVGISFAAGWQPNDFVIRPEAFLNNKQRMIDEIDIIRRLWRGEGVTFEGPKGPVEVQTLPRPVQKELPFFITAAGNPETFALAGRLGGGILTHLLGQSLEEARTKIEVYRQAWKAAGHAGEGTVVLMLHTFVGDDEAEVKEIVREPMKSYLRSSMMLIQQHAWSFPAFKRHAREDRSFKDNFLNLSSDDTDALLDHSFERYYETSGLFGTPESCVKMVQDCRGIGVDEIACLIDFGIDSQQVLESFPKLNALRAATSAPPANAGETTDYSIAAQLGRHSVSHMQCTPSMARMLVMNDEARAALAGLSHLMVGGEAFPGSLAADLREATKASITNMYGPTETTIWSSTQPAEPCEGTVDIGTPIANTQLYVLDASRQPVPVGVPGELWIGGDGVTRGYWQRPELTDERFVADPFQASSGARMYRTGDEVRWRRDGRVEFLGRIDHQVKIRGYRIELGEIEARLGAHESVREVVVIAREDTPGDKRLVAYILGEEPDAAALGAHLSETLPDFMVPAHYVRLDRFPLTPNKKIDRKALPRPDASARRGGEALVAPEGETEEKIATIWKSLLGLGEVGTEDNFFELGGHSLLAVQAHREIRSSTGAEISVVDVFRFPTISALAAHIDGDGDSDDNLQKSADRAAARRAARGGRRVIRRR